MDITYPNLTPTKQKNQKKESKTNFGSFFIFYSISSKGLQILLITDNRTLALEPPLLAFSSSAIARQEP